MRTIMKMKKIVVKEVKGYPGFRRYLNNQLVDLNYLTNEPAESRQWVFVLIFTTLLLNCVKMAIQFCQTSVNDLTYFIGDITIPLGSTKRQLALIYSSWLIGTSFCAFTLYRSQFNPYLQKWVSIGTIFDHLGSSKVHPHTRLPTLLHRYFIHLNRVAFYTGGIGALFLCLPSYFIYPQQFIVYLTVWLIITIFAGFVVLGSAGNFGPLYAFYLFLFGSEMVLERSKLSKRIDRSHVDSKERLTKIVASSYSSSTITLKSMIAGYRFWVLFNQSIFLATYSAQYILIYLICFIDIHKFLRLALIAFGAINLCSGLSIHFFLGAYAQRKIEMYCKKLRKTLYMDISLNVKLRVIIFLEHVEKRYFFTIFGALNYSHYHFIMVNKVMHNRNASSDRRKRLIQK